MQLSTRYRLLSYPIVIVMADHERASFSLLEGRAVREVAAIHVPPERKTDHEVTYSNAAYGSSHERVGYEESERLRKFTCRIARRLRTELRADRRRRFALVMKVDLAERVMSFLDDRSRERLDLFLDGDYMQVRSIDIAKKCVRPRWERNGLERMRRLMSLV